MEEKKKDKINVHAFKKKKLRLHIFLSGDLDFVTDQRKLVNLIATGFARLLEDFYLYLEF